MSILVGILLLGVAIVLATERNGKGKSTSGGMPKDKPEGKVKLMDEADATGVIFGKRGDKLACSPENEEGHIAIFGGSGLGKTLALLVQTLRKWLGTAFIIDIAGDVCKNVDMPNKLIYEPEDPESLPYNVFAEIDATADIEEKNELLANLAYLIIPDDRKDNSTSIFYKSEARKMLIGTFIAFYHMNYDFIEICKLIVECNWMELLDLVTKMRSFKANQFISSFVGTKGENSAGCKQALDRAINLFAFSDKLYGNIRRPKKGEQSISPDKLEHHNIFVNLDTSKLKVYAPLLHLIIAQSLDFIAKRDNYTGQTILFCLDELATFGKADLLDALRKHRKKRSRIMALTQSIADLDLIYGRDERKAMMDNFAFRVILGSEDPDTQEYFSKQIGERTVEKTRISTTKRPTKTIKQLQYGIGEYTMHGTEITTTEHEYEHVERIIPPAELGRLSDYLILLSHDGYMKLKKNFPPRDTIM